jgi:alpha-glucosidase (family GH31 glycosyl hydrolase)
MLCAQVWPGQAVFPDYLFNPNTYKWLKEQLAAWYQAVPFDGLWLDMNEPASFCEGQFCAPDPTNETSMHCECRSGVCELMGAEVWGVEVVVGIWGGLGVNDVLVRTSAV